MPTIYELGKAITENAAAKGFWNSGRPVIEDIDSSKQALLLKS